MADTQNTVSLPILVNGTPTPAPFLVGQDSNYNNVAQIDIRLGGSLLATGYLPVADISNGFSFGTLAAELGTIAAAVTGTLEVKQVVAAPGVGPVAYVPQASILQSTTVTTNGGTIVAAGAGGCVRFITIQTAPGSAGNVWLNPTGGTIAVGGGPFAAAGGGSFTFSPPPSGPIFAVSDSGNVLISATGA